MTLDLTSLLLGLALGLMLGILFYVLKRGEAQAARARLQLLEEEAKAWPGLRDELAALKGRSESAGELKEEKRALQERLDQSLSRISELETRLSAEREALEERKRFLAQSEE